MQIYLARNNVQAGPYTLEQLNQMLGSDQVDLNDLMWHEGLDEWQRVGNMTHEKLIYQPVNSAVNLIKINPEKIVNNRPSVDQLYGKTSSSIHSNTSSSANLDKKVAKALAPQKVGTNELASVSQRILAVLIDQVLALLCFVPLLSAFGFDTDKIIAVANDYVAISALIETLPMHLVMMTSLMILALFIIQTIMLVRRGQTLGKLATGVRILDVNTGKLPNFNNLILIRTLLTNLAYNLPYLGQFIALSDFIIMLFDKQKRSLHDKFAQTYVVKADDAQLAYKKPSDTKK